MSLWDPMDRMEAVQACQTIVSSCVVKAVTHRVSECRVHDLHEQLPFWELTSCNGVVQVFCGVFVISNGKDLFVVDQ